VEYFPSTIVDVVEIICTYIWPHSKEARKSTSPNQRKENDGISDL